MLRQASIENLKLIVVLNKIDRLILELKMTPQDAYLHLWQILEQLNVLITQQYASLVYEKEVSRVLVIKMKKLIISMFQRRLMVRLI